MTVKPDDILDFWENAGPPAWFAKNDDFDAEMTRRFMDFHQRAAQGEHQDWAKEANSALALTLVLDQFSRNMFRNDPRAFAQDEACQKLVHGAIESGFDKTCRPALVKFFYMPLMHSESILDQQKCVELMLAGGHHDNVPYAVDHRDIVRRFGRFPHRNAVLGRHTTPAEQAYLEAGGFSG